MKIIVKEFYIEPRYIAYFRFITEGYEGICLIHTVNSKLGIVKVSIPPHMLDEFNEVIESLRDELKGDNLIELIKFR